MDEKGQKKLRPIRMREAMRLIGFKGFWVGHFHLRWDAAAMEEMLQELLHELGLSRRLPPWVTSCASGRPASSSPS